MARTKKTVEIDEKNKKEVVSTKTKKKTKKTAKNGLKSQEKEKIALSSTEKEPVEPVIPAELDENVKKSKISKSNHKIKKVKTKKLKPVIKIDDVGEKSSEIIQQESRNEKDNDYELFKKLTVAQKTRQLLWGEVYGVEQHNKKVNIAVLWNGVKITIPDFEYFEPTFQFGSRYENASEEEKLKRRYTFASYQNGARVCFLVKGVVRNPIINGEFAGEHNIVCVASRKEAMELLRDINFYHKERKHALSNIQEIKPGSIANANIIAVKQDHIVVECLGVETRIFAHDTSCSEFVENCQDHFEPGQTLPVKILKIHINGTQSVYLKVTGKIKDSSKLITTMELRSSYIGYVESVNNLKKIYNIRLKNGVLAGVLFSNVQGNIPLFIGNKVSVKVSKINDSFVYGSAMKL